MVPPAAEVSVGLRPAGAVTCLVAVGAVGDAPPAPGGGGRAVARGPPTPVLGSRFGLGDQIGRRSVDYCHNHEAPHCVRGRCQ